MGWHSLTLTHTHTSPTTHMIGNVSIDPIFPGEAYDVYLSGNKMQRSERAELIRMYRKRVPFAGAGGGEGAESGGGKKGKGRRGGGEMDENDEFFHYN